jgi:hypothetical protein
VRRQPYRSGGRPVTVRSPKPTATDFSQTIAAPAKLGKESDVSEYPATEAVVAKDETEASMPPAEPEPEESAEATDDDFED